MNGIELAQVMRDNVDLHQALADAIKRISEGRGFVMGSAFMDCFRTDDLLEVLARTSRTSIDPVNSATDRVTLELLIDVIDRSGPEYA